MMIENKLDGKSFDIVEDNISKLKELFPEIVNGDNEVDIGALTDIFRENGETVVDDDGEEHYKFTWWGKKEAKRIAKETTTKTLRPYKKESKNWDTTQNIYIEGDNLDALKILLGSYRNRIKMIYIDPPYNTGKDFVYKDNRTQSTQEYLESTGQLSEERNLFENAKTDGKYHSNWLNMMYPRLVLAKKFLSEEGIILISIDENEVENLKKICDEIFGENNHVTDFIWKKTSNPNSTGNNIGIEHEYILVYSKSSKYSFNLLPLDEKDLEKYTGKDEYIDSRGPYKLVGLNKTGTVNDLRPNLMYDIIAPDGSIVKPKPRWRWSKEKFDLGISENRIVFNKSNSGWSVSYKQYLYEDTNGNLIERGNLIKTIFDDCGRTTDGTLEINNLIGRGIFDFPKPINLIKKLIYILTKNDDIVLDFFSGSATTANSLFEINSEDNFTRKFILIQIPELTSEKSAAYKSGYKNICEIGKERIRRAGDKIVEESGNKDLDIGFKVFKVDESNFIPWNPQVSIDNVEQAILSTADNLVDGRSELDLIYELLLKRNMDLNCPIEETDVNDKKVYIVDNGYALICLENDLDASIADDLLELKEDLMVEYCQVILKDEALDDNASININETLKSNNVEFYTI